MGKSQGHRPRPPVVRDPGLAKASGDAFLRLAQPFLEALERDMRVPAPPVDIPEMIASATNLSLAVELYLKSLRILVCMDPKRVHDLFTLFDGLPDELRAEIVRDYDALGVPPDHLLAAIETAIQPTTLTEPIPPPVSDAPDDPQDNSLSAVLKRSRDAFSMWRYLYERAHPDGYTYFLYEFHYLLNAAAVLSAKADALLAIWYGQGCPG